MWSLNFQLRPSREAEWFTSLATIAVVFLCDGKQSNSRQIGGQHAGLQQEITAEDPTGCLEHAHGVDASACTKKKAAATKLRLLEVQVAMHVWKIQFNDSRCVRSVQHLRLGNHWIHRRRCHQRWVNSFCRALKVHSTKPLWCWRFRHACCDQELFWSFVGICGPNPGASRHPIG